MIIELASIEVDPDRVEEFVEVWPKAAAIIDRAEGSIKCRLLRNVERAGRLMIEVQWEQLEDHTERFVRSSLFEEFRAVAGPFLQGPPQVQHFASVAG